MPLLRYFGFGGSALVLLLFGLSWCFPQPVSEPIHSGIDRPVVRISSVEQLPERVDIDTSLPTIVPPPIVMDFAERWPVAKIVETIPGPKPTTPTPGDGVPKKQGLVKREPVKKVVAHRTAPPPVNKPASNYREQAAAPVTAPVTRLSLLEILKERFEQNLFKLN
jgi:hypothetical protein